MSIIAIIPARGGSKEVEKKNIKDLAGKPLIAYTIETAKQSQSLNRIIVSTDDEEIASIARDLGAETPFIRPTELAQDDTPMLPVLQHAVNYLEGNENEKIDIIVLLDPTAPFRSNEDIEECINKLKETNVDSVVTVSEAEHNPYFVMIELDNDNMRPLIKQNKSIIRRQEAPTVYRLNAGVYAIKRATLMEKNKIITDNTKVVIMPHKRSVHIDSDIDFELAQSIATKKKFLVIGLGSMGNRRIRNLLALEIKRSDIIGLDKDNKKREQAEKKYKIKTFDNLDEAMKKKPDALIISTPPNTHIDFAMEAAKNNKHFFTEVNILDDLKKLEALIEEIRGKNIVASPSSTFRYNSLIKKMKKIVENEDLGRPLSFTYHVGQYLPDWHPWEDYRKFYVAKKEPSACREISIFELSWIKWLLGNIKTIACKKTKLSDLDIESEDTYNFILKFDKKILGNMQIDVISRQPVREFKLILEKGTIIWNQIKKTLKVFDAEENEWEEFREKNTAEKGYLAGESMYIEEMKNFIDAVNGKEKYDYTFNEELETIKTLFAAEESSDTKKSINIPIFLERNAPFVIAEIGCNHNGSMNIAKKLIDAAAEAGADAIKFQTFHTERLTTKTAPQADYQKKNTKMDQNQYNMLKSLELDYNDFKELKKYCDKKRIIFLSTPHSEDAINFLYDIVPAYKIGSGDLTNLPMLEKISKKEKPIILSTGMGNIKEVKEAVEIIKKYNKQIFLLHCTTSYPCPLNETNLNVIETLENETNLPVGYSDHSQENIVSIIAVSKGAKIIEKHFTLDKTLQGPDHCASIEPKELKELIKILKDPVKIKAHVKNMNKDKLKEILGSFEKKPSSSEKEIAKIVRKSITAAQNIEKDTILTEDMLEIKRPGTGIKPKHLPEFIGKKSKKLIKKDELLNWEDFE